MSKASRGLVRSHTPLITVEDLSPLRTLHLVVGSIHAIAAITIAFLAYFLQGDKKLALFSFIPGERPAAGGSLRWLPVMTKWIEFPISVWSPLFLFLAAFHHLSVATWARRWYEQNVHLRRNPARWLEYFFSASIMHVQVAMLCGILDAHLLLTIFFLTATTMIFGYAAEPHPSDPNLLPMPRFFWLGFIPYSGQWLVVFCYFFAGVKRALDPPDFVWAIIIVIFVLDLSFAVTTYLQLRRYRAWNRLVWSETAYTLLSLVAKQSLCWIVFGGIQSL